MSAFGSSLAVTPHDRTKPPRIWTQQASVAAVSTARFQSGQLTLTFFSRMWESLRALEAMTSAPVSNVRVLSPVPVPGVTPLSRRPRVPMSRPVQVPHVQSRFPVIRPVQPRFPVTRPLLSQFPISRRLVPVPQSPHPQTPVPLYVGIWVLSRSDIRDTS